MTPGIVQFLQGSRDVQANNLAVQALKQMQRGASVSGQYLSEAWKANESAAVDQNDALKARRAMLAREAYEARISSEKGRMMAAYALIAAREGNRAMSAEAAARIAKDSREQRVLIERARYATLRRDLMMEAAKTANASFITPPISPVDTVKSEMNQQVTLNMKSMWRPPSWVQRTNTFFPEDVRVAAGASLGALRGLAALPSHEWWRSFTAHQTDGVLKGFSAAQEAIDALVKQEPGAVQVNEDAKALMKDLQPQQVSTAVGAQTGLPWWMLPVGLATLYYFWK